MNKQYTSPTKRGIEWTDYTWNPVGGCQHKCRWQMPDGSIAICYAEEVAERVAQSAFPEGFAHHYFRPEALSQPRSLKTPSRIFLDSMSDLMGAWVADEQIEQVLDICRQAHWHQFQLLTKNAPRLARFTFPDNVWIGVSAPPTFMFNKQLSLATQIRMLNKMLSTLDALPVPIKWISIEPLSFDIAEYLIGHDLQWAVIGAASNGRKTYQPNPQWVQNALTVLDAQRIPVFFKGNLKWDDRHLRESFPTLTTPTPPTVWESAQPNLL